MCNLHAGVISLHAAICKKFSLWWREVEEKMIQNNEKDRLYTVGAASTVPLTHVFSSTGHLLLCSSVVCFHNINTKNIDARVTKFSACDGLEVCSSIDFGSKRSR